MGQINVEFSFLFDLFFDSWSILGFLLLFSLYLLIISWTFVFPTFVEAVQISKNVLGSGSNFSENIDAGDNDKRPEKEMTKEDVYWMALTSVCFMIFFKIFCHVIETTIPDRPRVPTLQTSFLTDPMTPAIVPPLDAATLAKIAAIPPMIPAHAQLSRSTHPHVAMLGESDPVDPSIVNMLAKEGWRTD